MIHVALFRGAPARVRVLLAAGLVCGSCGLAMAADTFSIPWFSINAGGTSAATGGGYTLRGTIAQPVAGMSVGNGYTLDAGFWQTVPVVQAGPIFNDSFEDSP